MMHGMMHRSFLLLAMSLALLAEGALAAPMELADAGPTTRAGFLPLDAVRAGLPPVMPRRTGAITIGPEPRPHMAPSGHFLPLAREQALPMHLAPASRSIALKAPFKRPAEDAADSDGDKGNAMQLMDGVERRVSSAKMTEGENLTVKQSWPLPAKAEQHFSSAFGMRRDPFTGGPEFHEGIDLSAPTGTSVLASADGTVEAVKQGHGFGKYIVVRHADDSKSIYGHMRKQVVRAGQQVRRGQKIGEVGSTGHSTGSHLHFQLMRGGQVVNPMTALRAPLAAGIGVASR